MPTEFFSGKTQEVRFVIDKANLETYATFEMDFPASFTIEPVESGDADFEFVNGKLKYSWMKLPSSSSVVLRFRLRFTQDSCSNFLFKGVFSFMERNKRGAVEIPETRVFYGSELAVKDCMKDASTLSLARIEVKREKPSYLAYNDTYNVILMVNNAARVFGTKFSVEEIVPVGYTIQALQSSGAVVKVVKNKIVLSWASIPEQERFMLVLRVKKIGKPKAEMTLSGKFTYMEGAKEFSAMIENFEDIDVDLQELRNKQIRQTTQQWQPQQYAPVQQPVQQPGQQPASGGQTAPGVQRDLNTTQQDFKKIFN
jgi:hypothetical protein